MSPGHLHSTPSAEKLVKAIISTNLFHFILLYSSIRLYFSITAKKLSVLKEDFTYLYHSIVPIKELRFSLEILTKVSKEGERKNNTHTKQNEKINLHLKKTNTSEENTC